ncbi:Uncharacterized protein PBTT_07107 [Plasmodiophora brassicae]|uniref:Uncharacterized protein n=1 Tax=Plasmodiophora brassicae TaxID=37360 RepID=A0A0G4J8V1_PLABS|nr:hypothetical protein PBRA_003298 [Plasmodiophora brassicae]SPQ99655.1 unnamed protein product [Plasmodiophora brassicae]
MDDEGLPWQFIIASCLEKQLHAYASLLGPAQAVARGLKHRAVSTAGADFLVSARVTGSVQAYLNLLRASPQPAASMLSYALAFYSSLPSEGVTLPDSLLPRLQTAVSAMDPAMVEEATQQARCVLAKIRADYSGDSGRDEDASEEDSGDALSERMCTGVTSRGAHGHGMGASPASCPFLNPPNQQDWSTRLIRIAIALCVAAGLAVVIIETYRDLSSGGRWRAEL